MTPPEDPVGVLQRWADCGAIWRVLTRQRDFVTIGLYTCTDSEEVDRFTSSDPGLLRYLAEQQGIEQSEVEG